MENGAIKITTHEEIVRAQRLSRDLWMEISRMKGVEAFNFLTGLTSSMATALCCSTIGKTSDDRSNMGVAQENRDMAYAISSLLDILNKLNQR